MDECLRNPRSLGDGTPVTFAGEFFSLQDALIVPAPSPRIPLIVGGRSETAVRRATRLGDGWLGIWVSPRRFAAVRNQITREATEAGRDGRGFEHALNVWCGFGSTREAAREPLAMRMQALYQMPFEPFERYSPHGKPEHVAEFLRPYIDAGCSVFNVIPCADDADPYCFQIIVRSEMAANNRVRAIMTATWARFRRPVLFISPEGVQPR
jgi:alkanesulfonate monooxygenase SsuD/methylene tetrahydromethanopterin reductase-like flavin-dependent oxidoreductase (luciferase family)